MNDKKEALRLLGLYLEALELRKEWCEVPLTVERLARITKVIEDFLCGQWRVVWMDEVWMDAERGRKPHWILGERPWQEETALSEANYRQVDFLTPRYGLWAIKDLEPVTT